MGRDNLCRCLQAPVVDGAASAASRMPSTAKCVAEPQPHSHFTEAAPSCGSMELGVMAHIPLAAHASLKITVPVGTKTVVEVLGVGDSV